MSPTAATTIGGTASSGGSSSSSGGPVPSPFVFTQTGDNVKKYGVGQTVSGSYTNGQECCDLCAANNINTQWALYAKPGTSTPSECMCDVTDWEPWHVSSGSNDYAKGTCKLPIEYVYTESGTGKRYNGGYSVGGT